MIETGVVQLVSRGIAGQTSNGHAFTPAVSSDGRLVAFASNARNLVASQTQGINIFVKDLSSNETILIGEGTRPTFSPDGSYITYTRDTQFFGSEIVVRSLVTGSATSYPYKANGAPSLSQDGRILLFASDQNALLPNVNGSQIYAAALPIPSDFNNSGLVDGRDFLAWQRGFGIVGDASKGDGDADGDGDVDSSDLTIWQSDYGAGSDSPLGSSQGLKDNSAPVIFNIHSTFAPDLTNMLVDEIQQECIAIASQPSRDHDYLEVADSRLKGQDAGFTARRLIHQSTDDVELESVNEDGKWSELADEALKCTDLLFNG